MSRAIKKIPYKFVHVFWIDITSDSSWRSIEDVKEESLPRCLSTGFLTVSYTHLTLPTNGTV